MSKLKSKRGWLEAGNTTDGEFHSGSSYTIVVGKANYNKGELTTTFTDCNRAITWYFGKPGNKQGVAKITTIKKLVDELYEHMTSVEPEREV